ncbi:MAG: NAD-dependent epimerase/dehydratase [Acidobacteriota bacterium]
MTARGASALETVLVTGGGGYVGSALVPRLLDRGHAVRVLDLFWYGREALAGCRHHPRLEVLRGDLRDAEVVARAVTGVDAVVHLACISNDPSFELDPALGRSINLDAFPPLIDAARAAGVARFVYASSSSVYGVKAQPHVREDATPKPLTDYSRFKLACEDVLLAACRDEAMEPVILRPATVCGVAPRLRLDLTVNILSAHALDRGTIRVFGGRQLRPNLHVQDMAAAYEAVLDAPSEQVRGQVFNVGGENLAVGEIAHRVRDVLDDIHGAARAVEIRVEPSDDLRSYHIESSKFRSTFGLEPRFGIDDAVRELADLHARGGMPDPLANPRFHNIRRMQEVLGATSSES